MGNELPEELTSSLGNRRPDSLKAGWSYSNLHLVENLKFYFIVVLLLLVEEVQSCQP